MNGKLSSSKGKFVSVGQSATAASKGVNGLTRAVTGFLGAFAGVQTAKFVFFKTAELETQTRSLQVLTGSLETAKGIIGELQAFGRVTPFTSSELVETAKRLKAFGIETEDLVDTTKRLGDVAGATGAELDGIATAFGQIRAKGKLQQEENLQLLERGVDLTSELRKMYNLSGEELAAAMTKGQISFEAANEALRRLTDAGGKYAGGAIAQSDTLAGRFSTLKDNIDTLARTLGQVLTPALKNVLSIANDALAAINSLITKKIAQEGFKLRFDLQTLGNTGGDLNKINQFFDEIQNRVNTLDAQGVKDFYAEVNSIQGALQRTGAFENTLNPFGAGPNSDEFERTMGRAIRLVTLLGERQKELRELGKTQPTAVITPPLQLMEGGKPDADKEAEKEKKRLEQLALASAQRAQSLRDEVSLLNTRNEEEERLVQLNIEIRKIQENTLGLTEEQVRAEIEALLAKQDATIAAQAYNDEQDASAKKAKELADQQKRAAEELAQTYRTIGDSIKTGVVDMLRAAVDETKSLAEVASNVLMNIANTLLNIGITSAFGALGKTGGILGDLFGTGATTPDGRASGGTVTGGTSYVVGEKGPELFTPGRTGSIAPNSAMASTGPIVVNVDATGSTAEGDTAKAKALGDALGSAVRLELLKQKRPGGLLA